MYPWKVVYVEVVVVQRRQGVRAQPAAGGSSSVKGQSLQFPRADSLFCLLNLILELRTEDEYLQQDYF